MICGMIWLFYGSEGPPTAPPGSPTAPNEKLNAPQKVEIK